MSAKPECGTTWRQCAFQAFILLVLLVVLFPRTFFQGETVLPASLLFHVAPWNQHVPPNVHSFDHESAIEVFLLFNMYYSVAKAALAHGEWPLWNHLEFGGMPLLANYQSAVFYPLRLLHAIFDVPIATSIFVILKLWLCGMTAFLCARKFRLSMASSSFVSVAWMLSGYQITWAYFCIPDVAAWLPILLIGVEFLFEQRYARGFSSVLVAAVMMLFAGHPESAFTGSAGVGLYFILRLLLARRWGRPLFNPIAVALGAWILAIAVCAAQILPFLEYLGQSQTYLHRLVGPENLHFMSIPEAPVIFVPRFFGPHPTDTGLAGGIDISNFLTMAYSGIAVSVALLLLLSRGAPNSERRQRMIALAVPTLLCLLMAFNAPMMGLILALPALKSTWGCWYMALPMFSFPLLGGIALDRWQERHRSLIELALPILGALGIAAIVWMMFNTNGPLLAMQGKDAYVRTQLWIAACLTLTCVVFVYFTPRPQTRAGASWAFVAVLAIDLVHASRGMIASSPRSQLFFDTPLTQKLESLEQPARINLTFARIHTGLMQVYGLEEQWGYDGILPDRMFTFLGRISGQPSQRLRALTATNYYLEIPDGNHPSEYQTSFERLGSYDGVDVWHNPNAYPRAFLATKGVVASDADALFAQLTSEGFDPRTTVITDAPPTMALPSPLSENAGTAVVRTRSSTSVSIDVKANQESILVLLDAYYPSWTVKIDDLPGSVFPAYYAFRGIVVPQGSHHVDLTYTPWTFRVGLAISTAALCVSFLSAFFILLTRRRTQA